LQVIQKLTLRLIWFRKNGVGQSLLTAK